MSDLEWAMNIHRIAKLVVEFHADKSWETAGK